MTDPRDEVCPEPGCGKTIREHIEEGKALERKIHARNESFKAAGKGRDERQA